MNKITKKETFGWVNENGGRSEITYTSKTDAARNGITKNPGQSNYIYVVGSNGRYIGLAEGINFHSTS